MPEETVFQQVLHSGATGTANGNIFSVSGYDTVLFNVSNIGTSTVAFESSVDNTNWFPITTTNVSSNSSGTTASATGMYRTSVTGLHYVRAKVSSYTAGTVAVDMTASTGEGAASAGGGAAEATAFGSSSTSGQPAMGVYQATPTAVGDGTIGVARISANRAWKTDADTLMAGEDLTNNVQGQLQKPVASSTYAPSQHTNFGAAAGTGVLVKGTAGNVYGFDVTSATTALRYFQIFNQGTVAVVGQTPIASYELGSVPAGSTYRLQVSSSDLAPSIYCGTGIAAAISSTKGTLGTASITAADYSWHIKYV